MSMLGEMRTFSQCIIHWRLIKCQVDKYRVMLFFCVDTLFTWINRINCSVITIAANKHIIERGFSFTFLEK